MLALFRSFGEGKIPPKKAHKTSERLREAPAAVEAAATSAPTLKTGWSAMTALHEVVTTKEVRLTAKAAMVASVAAEAEYDGGYGQVFGSNRGFGRSSGRVGI